ncbi:MAG TPA: phage portal protein [Candidatus Sumerlaeota bacterium]|nr:phage portal protein [Candidatus Sumerlaeota bacterium]
MKRSIHNPFTGRYDQQGYRAAKYARENRAELSYGSADFQMRYDRETIIALSRQLDQDNWLYEAIFNRFCDYVLGPAGFTIQAKTSDDYINDKIEQELWPKFAESPEITGEFDYRDCQEITLRERGVAGDTLWVELGPQAGEAAGKLQHIEAERIASGRRKADNGDRVEQGVQLDRSGRRVAYYIADVDDVGVIHVNDAKPYPAFDCHYVPGRVKRSSETRRMPVLNSSISIAHRIDDILTSEAVAWQVLSRLVATLKREGNAVGKQAVRKGINARAKTDGDTQSAAQLVSDLGMAILFQAGPKDDLSVVAQNRPSQQFKDSLMLFVRLFGVPLGMPLEILLLDWQGANYSNARAILLQAFLAFRIWQHGQVAAFDTPVYRRRIGRWIADGSLPWRPDIFNHTVDLPGWPWIDEDKEVSAWAKKIDRAIATQTEALASLGKDRREQLRIRKREILEAWQAAREIEEETRGEIKAAELWRHLAALDMGKTQAAVLSAKENTNAATQ